jgi:glycosyltransferase involved in cell wall biosynthesis
MHTPSVITPPPGLSRVVRRALRVAVLAPPWIPVPPSAYGGIEAVVALLSDELTRRGHDVTLFAAPGSHSAATVDSPLEHSHPDRIGSALYESDYVASVYDTIDQALMDGRPFDVVHDHSGFTALAMAHRISTPVVHTLHGPFDAQTAAFYQRHGHKARLVAISHSQLQQAPPGVRVTDAISNPMVLADWPLCTEKDDYLLWIGRMDPVKGAHRAIAAARRAGRCLVLAGPIQPGQEDYYTSKVAPRLDGEQIVYIGEVGGARRKELFARAKGFLMPIRWAEPFGMVMVEALACGTPVVAFPEGAAREIVIDGENGFHVTDELQMASAIDRLDALDPHRCRESVAERYDASIIVDGYEAVFNSVLAPAPRERFFDDRRRPARQLEAVHAPRRAARAPSLEFSS